MMDLFVQQKGVKCSLVHLHTEDKQCNGQGHKQRQGYNWHAILGVVRGCETSHISRFPIASIQ